MAEKTIVKPRAKVATKTKRPPLYKVILLNDDYTPREFVVQVLKAVFRMNAEHGPAKQSKHEPGDGAREHRAPDRQPDEVVVHHASRLGLTLDRRKIKSASAIAGTANP